MINSTGADTSILFGFTKYLLELIEREKPTHLAVSFDPPGGTFRNEMYPAYKANRPPTPQLVIDALEPLCRILEAMGIKVVMKPASWNEWLSTYLPIRVVPVVSKLMAATSVG